jgi:hypothetical protein
VGQQFPVFVKHFPNLSDWDFEILPKERDDLLLKRRIGLKVSEVRANALGALTTIQSATPSPATCFSRVFSRRLFPCSFFHQALNPFLLFRSLFLQPSHSQSFIFSECSFQLSSTPGASSTWSLQSSERRETFPNCFLALRSSVASPGCQTSTDWALSNSYWACCAIGIQRWALALPEPIC